MEERSNEFTIKDLIGIVVPKFWIVAIISILVSAVVGVCSSFFDKDESYSTTVQFYVHFGATEANSIDIAKARQLVPVYISAYKSRSFGDNLLEEVKKSSYVKNNEKYSNLSGAVFSSMFSFSLDEEVPIMNITVTHSDPEFALTVAEALTKLSYDYSVYEGEEEDSDVEVTLPIHDLVPHKAEFKIYQRAELPTVPNNTDNTFKSVIIAFFASAVLTLAAIVTIALLDTTVHDRKKLESALSVPVLGVIPKYTTEKKERSCN